MCARTGASAWAVEPEPEVIGQQPAGYELEPEVIGLEPEGYEPEPERYAPDRKDSARSPHGRSRKTMIRRQAAMSRNRWHGKGAVAKERRLNTFNLPDRNHADKTFGQQPELIIFPIGFLLRHN